MNSLSVSQILILIKTWKWVKPLYLFIGLFFDLSHQGEKPLLPSDWSINLSAISTSCNITVQFNKVFRMYTTVAEEHTGYVWLSLTSLTYKKRLNMTSRSGLLILFIVTVLVSFKIFLRISLCDWFGWNSNSHSHLQPIELTSNWFLFCGSWSSCLKPT